MRNELLMPGQRVCEYRLLVPLSETLQETVRHIRRQLHEKYRIPLPFELPPSLTILHCHAYESAEPKLIERIQQVATRTAAFNVELKNFGAESLNTIYIPVITHHPLQQLVKEVKVVKSLAQIPDHDPHFVHEPHLLIAQNLKPFQFTRMWMDCEHTAFTGRFTADGIVLMKRSAIRTCYEEAKRFEFASLSQMVKQGTLFG